MLSCNYLLLSTHCYFRGRKDAFNLGEDIFSTSAKSKYTTICKITLISRVVTDIIQQALQYLCYCLFCFKPLFLWLDADFSDTSLIYLEQQMKTRAYLKHCNREPSTWVSYCSGRSIKLRSSWRQVKTNIPNIVPTLTSLILSQWHDTKISWSTNLDVRLTVLTGDVSSAVSEVSSASTSISSSLLKWENTHGCQWAGASQGNHPLMCTNSTADTVPGSVGACAQPTSRGVVTYVCPDNTNTDLSLQEIPHSTYNAWKQANAAPKFHFFFLSSCQLHSSLTRGLDSPLMRTGIFSRFPLLQALYFSSQHYLEH